MPEWGWAVIGVAIALIVVLVVIVAVLQRRTARLRQRFGSEYERTVAAEGGRRPAEAALAERAQRRDTLTIRPLDEVARRRYVDQWRMLQGQFVDDPAGAVGGADRLIQSAMQERGYPVEDFDQRAADISVDHPDVVENYREGHRLARAAALGDGSTEDLRQAMQHYRALFDELLEESTDAPLNRDRSTAAATARVER
jgi:hypothetical protein